MEQPEERRLRALCLRAFSVIVGAGYDPATETTRCPGCGLMTGQEHAPGCVVPELRAAGAGPFPCPS